MIRATLLLLTLSLAAATAFPQKGEQLTFTMKGDRIVRGVLLSVEDSLLTIDTTHESLGSEDSVHAGDVVTLPLDSVRHVWFDGHSYTWAGVGAGLLVGTAAGWTVGSLAFGSSEDASGLENMGTQFNILGIMALGALTGIIIGGNVGSNASTETVELHAGAPDLLPRLEELAVFQGPVSALH